jgi:hypothetical protein
MYCIHTYLHIEEEEKNKVVRIEGVKEGRKEGRKEALTTNFMDFGL